VEVALALFKQAPCLVGDTCFKNWLFRRICGRETKKERKKEEKSPWSRRMERSFLT